MVLRVTRLVPAPNEPTLVTSSGPKRREKASCASSVTSWPRKTRTECSSRAARATLYAASSAAISASVTPRSSAANPGPRGTISIGDLPFGVCSTFPPNRPARNAAGGDRPLDEDLKKQRGGGRNLLRPCSASSSHILRALARAKHPARYVSRALLQRILSN